MRWTNGRGELRLSRWWQARDVAYFYQAPGGWRYEIRLESIPKAFGSPALANLEIAIKAAKERYKELKR